MNGNKCHVNKMGTWVLGVQLGVQQLPLFSLTLFSDSQTVPKNSLQFVWGFLFLGFFCFVLMVPGFFTVAI